MPRRRASVLNSVPRRVLRELMRECRGDAGRAEAFIASLRSETKGRQESQRARFYRRVTAVVELEERIARTLERRAAWKRAHPGRRYGGPSVHGIAKRFPYRRFRCSERALRAWRRLEHLIGYVALAADGRGRGARGVRVRVSLAVLKHYAACVRRGDAFNQAYSETIDFARRGGFVAASHRTIRRRVDELASPSRE